MLSFLGGFVQPIDEAGVYVGIGMQEQVPSCDQIRFSVCVLCIEIIQNQDENSVSEAVD